MDLSRLLSRDFTSGAIFVLIGGLGLYIGQGYRVGTALDMGPGYIPRLLCWLLIGLGVVIGTKGLVAGAERMPRIHVRPLALVTGSIVLFAFLLAPAGLAIAAAATVVMASLAAQDSKIRETVLLAVGLAAAAGLVFVAALGLPIRFWPW